MKLNKNLSESISDRIIELMETKGVKAYKVCKDTKIPEGTFSRSIKTPDTWKLQHLEKLSKYFMVSLDYLVTGDSKHIDEKIQKELYKMKEEVLILREKVATYEFAAKQIIQESKKQKTK